MNCTMMHGSTNIKFKKLHFCQRCQYYYYIARNLLYHKLNKWHFHFYSDTTHDLFIHHRQTFYETGRIVSWKAQLHVNSCFLNCCNKKVPDDGLCRLKYVAHCHIILKCCVDWCISLVCGIFTILNKFLQQITHTKFRQNIFH